MLKADPITRAIAGLVDLLIVIGLARLPDVIGFLSATGYILVRDGLFEPGSIGKKLIGLWVMPTDPAGTRITYRESIIRNVPLAVVFFLFLVPYAGWMLGPAALIAEMLAAVGDRQGMRIGDLIARTMVIQATRTTEAPRSTPTTAPAVPEAGERGTAAPRT